MLEAYQKQIIKLMIKQELLLAELYGIFGNRFSEYATFWYGLAEEEKKHAEWVKKLYKAEKKDLVAFTEDKIKTYTMKAYIDYVEKNIERANNGEFNIKTAVARSLDLEMSLIEKKYFTHFHIIKPNYKGIMIMLENETKKHIKAIRDLIAKLS